LASKAIYVNKKVVEHSGVNFTKFNVQILHAQIPKAQKAATSYERLLRQYFCQKITKPNVTRQKLLN
jgi:hypothetical protein